MTRKSILHEELWHQLVALDGPETAERAGCKYFDDPECYVITLLNQTYAVSLTERQIFPAPSGAESQPAEYMEQLCLLAFLINAKNVPLAGKLVSAESLPGGQFFFRGPHSLPTGKLEKAFGEKPALLYRAAAQFSAEKCEFGDASVRVFVLPRVPLVFVLWAGDEEFEARASILFDKMVSAQLPLDALMAAVNLAVNALITAAKQKT